MVSPCPEAYKDSGYIPPQTFIYIDHHGLVQNENNIPILYHWGRNKAIKRPSKFIYSTSISSRDHSDLHCLNMKTYWWLSNELAHIHDLKTRRNEIIRRSGLKIDPLLLKLEMITNCSPLSRLCNPPTLDLIYMYTNMYTRVTQI